MTEMEIIQSIQGSSSAQEMALQALYRKAAEFRRHFMFKGLPREAADDVVQDTIIKIFRGAKSFTGSGGFGDASANAWMWNIAKNCLTDQLRKNKDAGTISLDDDTLSDATRVATEIELSLKNPHASAEQSASECVATGLEDFAADHPDRAKALEMQMDGESIASIAQRIGRESVNAAKQYLYECRKKLAPYIEHCTTLLTP